MDRTREPHPNPDAELEPPLAGRHYPRPPFVMITYRRLLLAAAFVDIALSAMLVVVWAIERPRPGSDSADMMFIAAMVAAFCGGGGWYLTSRTGCAIGCAAQLARFAGLVAMLVFALSAFNSHMDNPCLESPAWDDCVGDAGRWYFRVYAAITASALLSGVLLYLKQRDEL